MNDLQSNFEKTEIGRPRNPDQIDSIVLSLRNILDGNVEWTEGTIDITDVILPLLRDPDKKIMEKVTHHLVLSGEKAVPALLDALQDKDEKVCAKAISILGKIGSQRAIEPLIECLSRENREIALSAIEALKNIGPKCVSKVLRAFMFAEASIKNYMAFVLAEIGDVRGIEALFLALTTEDYDLCAAAAGALSKIGGERAIQAIVEKLTQSSRFAQECEKKGEMDIVFNLMALQAHLGAALVKTGSACVPALLEALNQAEYIGLKKIVVSILGQIRDRTATFFLLKMIENHASLDGTLAKEIVHALKNLRDPESIPVLSSILWKEGLQKGFYEALIQVFGELEEGRQEIVNALRHKESAVRFYAVLTIQKNGYTEAIDRLIPMLQDPNPLVSTQVANTLEKFGGKALGPLIELFGDPKYGKKADILKMIKRIGRSAIKKLAQSEISKREETADTLNRILDFSLDGIFPPRLEKTNLKLNVVAPPRIPPKNTS